MEIKKEQTGSTLTLSLSGRLDTITSPELEQVISSETEDVTDLILDMKELAYISSAGLRVLLTAQKKMTRQGSMKLIHVCEDVKEVLEMTGFIDFLTVES